MVFVLIACANVCHLLPTTVADRIDLFVYDMRLRLQTPVMDSRVVIVDIDQKSLNELGRWPWSRDTIADLVHQLSRHYHAKVIGFDVMFSEPDTSSGYATLEALAKRELKAVPGFQNQIQALKPVLDFDARLAKAFEDQPVVLGFYLSNHEAKGLLPSPAFSVKDLGGHELDSLSWNAYDGSLPQLQRAAKAGGYINTELDPDGLLRSVPLIARLGEGYYESLALATVRVALGATTVSPIFPPADAMLMSESARREYGVLEAIKLNSPLRSTRIPVEQDVKMLIQYRGFGGPKGGAFPYISAVDILKKRVPKDDLDQRIILVGTTAPGLNDLRATPLNKEYPGVEAHANIISSILDGKYKQRPDFATSIDLIQNLVVGIILVFALSVLSPVLSILFTVTLTAFVILFNFWMYYSADFVLPVATVLLLILWLFLFNIAWGYLFEHRKGRAIVSLFGEYVAPELVAEMAEDPESYNMEGESRELSVLFADVRGFTTISEGLSPNALREYINLYLTAMSENIRGNRGTLDKYIGDAVMAFWGAPVALPNHASLAVMTALTMQATTKKLNQDFIARGWPPLKIGIGLNTGQMRVGDMGSKIRRAYTVMGDAVNLSSRLEGITKVYGVGIVVGEMTQLAAPEFAYRELDRVRVKGKLEPVPIYEPIARLSDLTDEMRVVIAQWHTALSLVRTQFWDDAEQIIKSLYSAHPDDGLYLLYLERIAIYRAQPPGNDWDGVTTFDTK